MLPPVCAGGACVISFDSAVMPLSAPNTDPDGSVNSAVGSLVTDEPPSVVPAPRYSELPEMATGDEGGAFAALGVFGIGDYTHLVDITSSDPMVLALCLAAIDQHLSDRPRATFACRACGLALHADCNAARNILWLGSSLRREKREAETGAA